MNHDNYNSAVKVIKTAILQAQSEALISVNEKEIVLYYSIGRYISETSKKEKWGTNALEIISIRLEREMPGLRGFSRTSLQDMRRFYEEWKLLENLPNSNLAPAGVKLENSVFSKQFNIPIKDFLSIGFTLHRTIIFKIKDFDQRLFYIHLAASLRLTRNQLIDAIETDLYSKREEIPNNFFETLPTMKQARKTINAFKDSYMLDFINVEEIDARDKQEIDERVVEQEIIHNIKKFILTFGKDFAFIGNQYHIEAFEEDHFIDLLFFNRELNCLVAIELKKGKFKPSYLGQLSAYLSLLTKFEKKPHENPPIGIILCKDSTKSSVDFFIQDYKKPMGVATYTDMSEKIKENLPSIEELEKLLDSFEKE